MNMQGNLGSSSTELSQGLAIINELAFKSANGNYIFRGESECNDEVSSSLYREYKRITQGIAQRWDIEAIQRARLASARAFTSENDERELLTQIQHYGGSTNLIDFTRDYLIALFFACDGNHSAPGRVILIDRGGSMSKYILRPNQPTNRVIAQKSIFVRHPTGLVTPDDEIIIPADLKLSLLDYLDSAHGISPETMHNDVHGYIRYRAMHSEAFRYLIKGLNHHMSGDYKLAIEKYDKAISLNPHLTTAFANRGDAYFSLDDYDSAISDFSIAIRQNSELMRTYHQRGHAYARIGNYEYAISDFNEVIAIDPDYGPAYCDRGEAGLHLSEWDNARDDFDTAQNMDVDIVASFRNDYTSVADFEQRNGITLPDDIAEMLGG